MNQQFFSGLFPAMKSYVGDAFSAPVFGDWVFVFIPIIATWILSGVYLKFRRSGERTGRVADIYFAWIVVGCIVSLVFLGYFIYLWGTGYYKNSAAEFWHLMSFLTAMAVPLVGFAFLSSHFDREKVQNLIRQPLTTRDKHVRVSAMRRFFSQLKFTLLVVLLGFVMIPILKAPYNMVSIVIDNTASMKQPLEHGKQALNNTIRELNNKTHVLLTFFPDDPDKSHYTTEIQTVLSASSSARLSGVSAFYQDKEAAIAGINDIQLLSSQTGFSPLYEVIMHNRLRTMEEVEQQAGVVNYEGIVSVVVTDGHENTVQDSLGSTTRMFCDDSTYKSDFFDEVFFIDILRSDFGGGSESVLFNNIGSCDYEILAGSNLSSYEQSLKDILGDFSRDWYFIGWLVIIYLLILLITALIRPKKLV